MKKIISDKWELAALCIKGLTGVLGGSMILENNHPYLTLAICGVGAVANEVVIFIQKRKNEKGSS